MGKNSKKNKNPNWRAEQSALAERSRMVRVHEKTATFLKFSDRVLQRNADGSLVRIG